MRLWKTELQTLADQTGLSIAFAHLPPGISKWNRIEHRLFAFITQNWRGKPLLTHPVIIQLIASTTMQTGLTVQCRLDENTYEKGTKVSDAQIASLNITPAEFHGDWDYTIAPRTRVTRGGCFGSGTKAASGLIAWCGKVGRIALHPVISMMYRPAFVSVQ